jgi:LuxR family maltose regulon positive regulatory protein
MELGEPFPPDLADLHRELGELYLEQFDLESAAQHLQKSKEMGEKAKIPVWRYRWNFSQARFKVTQNNLDSALELLNEAEKLHIRTPLPDLCPISAMKARIWITQSKLTKAMEWVKGQDLTVDDDLSFLREFEHITLARLLLAQYQKERREDTIYACLRLLDRLLDAAEKGNRMGIVIEILIVQSLAHQAQRNIDSALASLERALTLAEPEGYIRIFVIEGKPVAELLARIQANEETHRVKEFISKLYAAFDLQKEFISFSGTTAKYKRPSESSQHLIEPLSERELEILKLLRSELSGPEIARDRMVSLSTIRTHTQRIFAKLGVNNRRAAVRRAEELDLF